MPAFPPLHIQGPSTGMKTGLSTRQQGPHRGWAGGWHGGWCASGAGVGTRWGRVCEGLCELPAPALTQRVSWAQGLGGHAAVHREVEGLLHFGPDDSVRKKEMSLERRGGKRAQCCPGGWPL